MPPNWSYFSNTVTAWPCLRNCNAAVKPPQPPPMIATFLPVGLASTSNLNPSSLALSPINCSTALMPIVSSTSLRLQPSSQGAGQTRPIIDGNGFASVERLNAYSCHVMSPGGVSMPRTISNQPRILWPDGHEP